MREIKARVKRILRWLEVLCRNWDNAPPIYPRKLGNEGVKVHVGAGSINLQGWVNVDARNYDHIHIATHGFDLEMLSDGTVQEIYMCHVLEHFAFGELSNVLKGLSRKIRSGGLLRISVPDFAMAVRVYCDTGDIKKVQWPLMGGQDYDLNFHKSIFDKDSLTELMRDVGFRDIHEWSTEETFGCDIGDHSNDAYFGKKNFPLSLNLVGVRR